MRYLEILCTTFQGRCPWLWMCLFHLCVEKRRMQLMMYLSCMLAWTIVKKTCSLMLYNASPAISLCCSYSSVLVDYLLKLLLVEVLHLCCLVKCPSYLFRYFILCYFPQMINSGISYLNLVPEHQFSKMMSILKKSWNNIFFQLMKYINILRLIFQVLMH